MAEKPLFEVADFLEMFVLGVTGNGSCHDDFNYI